MADDLVPDFDIRKSLFMYFATHVVAHDWPDSDTHNAELQALIRQIATAGRVDPALVEAVVRAESGFDHLAVSHRGAQGLMQLMPKTARAVGVKNSFSAHENLRGGVTYLRQMLDLFDGDTRLALAAYNAGPTTVLHYRDIPPFEETRVYVDRVFRFREQIRSRR